MTVQTFTASAIAGIVPNSSGNFTLTKLGNASTTNESEFGLIKFNTSAIVARNSVTISDAKLRLNLTNNNSATKTLDLEVHRSLRAWVYNQVTRDVYATGQSWQTVNGVGNNDREAATTGTYSFATGIATGAWYEIDLDNTKVQEMIRGSFTDNGFMLWGALGVATEFSSRTFAFTGADQAQLVLTYTNVPSQNNMIWWE